MCVPVCACVCVCASGGVQWEAEGRVEVCLDAVDGVMVRFCRYQMLSSSTLGNSDSLMYKYVLCRLKKKN